MASATVTRLTKTIRESVLAENTRAFTENNQAMIDYNVMMGYLEDPNAEDETEVEE